MSGNDDLTRFALLNHLPVGVFILQQDFTVLFWNTVLEEWTGIPRETILHQNIGHTFPHITEPTCANRLRDVFSGESRIIFSAELHHHLIPAHLSDGQPRIQHTTVTPLPASDGQNWYAMFTIEDHTRLSQRLQNYQTLQATMLAETEERRAVDKVLHQRLAVEELVATISTRFVKMADKDVDNEIFRALQAVGQIVAANYIYFDWFSPDRTHVEHHYNWARDPRLMSPLHRPLEDYQWLLHQFHQQQPVSVSDSDRLPPAASPEKAWLNSLQAQSWLALPLFLSGDLAGACGLTCNNKNKSWSTEDIRLLQLVGEAILNVLTRRRWQNTLHQARKSAEAANRAKSLFLANMSHELRTPLNAILGFAQIMADDTALSPEGKQNLHTIRESGEHLLAIITDILEMSRIEADHTTLQEDNFNLHQLLTDVRKMFAHRAEKKGLVLHFDLAANVPRYILQDQHKLRQILVNMLSNALKFTVDGQISWRVYCADPADKQSAKPALFFEIADTGSGIDPADMDTLFEPFVQTANGKKLHDGTGLGLSISRQFARMMGGDLTVNSTPGHGATFTFSIQLNQIGAIDQPSAADPSPRSRKSPAPAKNDSRQLSVLLAACPPEWLAKLEQAVIEANLNLIEELTNQIQPDAPDVAQALETLTFDFEFDKILTALSRLET